MSANSDAGGRSSGVGCALAFAKNSSTGAAQSAIQTALRFITSLLFSTSSYNEPRCDSTVLGKDEFFVGKGRKLWRKDVSIG